MEDFTEVRIRFAGEDHINDAVTFVAENLLDERNMPPDDIGLSFVNAADVNREDMVVAASVLARAAAHVSKAMSTSGEFVSWDEDGRIGFGTIAQYLARMSERLYRGDDVTI